MNERARVPFALVGVLLLVSSATLSASIGTYQPEPPATERALDGATAESATVLRGAIDEAARDSAANPVTRPADTTAGRALSEETPFRDALRLRIYLTARERLDGVEVERGDVVATASLPPVEPTTEGYRRAIERVRIERGGEDRAALEATLEGVELIATRGGRSIERVEHDPTLVVAAPVLELHDRVERFETRLNRDVRNSGLARRLTARLYPIAWTRGTAQYGGAPIATVVGTRHVELATNDALVSEQRAIFGAADPSGDRGVAAAGRRIATTDLLVGVGGEEAWTDAVLTEADRIGSGPPAERSVGTWRDPPNESDVSVGVDRSADRAYAAVTGIDSDDTLTAILDRVRTVEARVDADAKRVGRTETHRDSPGDGWRLVESSTQTRTELSATPGSSLERAGWETCEMEVFAATETEITVRTWRRGDQTRTTRSTIETRYRVRVAVLARTLPVQGTPPGRLDGALADTTALATDRARNRAGGIRGAARRAVAGGSSSWSAEATASAESTTTRDDLAADLGTLRERTRNVTVSVSGPAVGAGRANPPGALRSELDDRRSEFTALPGRMPEDRARSAARTAYLDALDDALEQRANTHRRTADGIGSSIGNYLDSDRLDGALAAHRSTKRSDGPSLSDPAGDLAFAVETAPAYLPTRPVARDRIDVHGGGRVTPLATRNVNVFASPHGDLSESLIDRIPWLGTRQVPLSTAARTLQTAERTDGMRDERSTLRGDVVDADTYVREELVAALTDEGIALREAENAVASDASPADRALALTNGSDVERIVDEIEANDADRIHVRLRLVLKESLSDDAARPSHSETTEVAAAARERYRDEIESIAAEGAESAGEIARKRLLGERLGSLPAGLPIAPVPGYWYATANVWYVESGGRYERFAVRANRTDGTVPTVYLRDGDVARIDHAGETRRFGRAERISFRVSTAVVVVVPPGGSGVGDTDGVVDERSDGWPP